MKAVEVTVRTKKRLFSKSKTITKVWSFAYDIPAAIHHVEVSERSSDGATCVRVWLIRVSLLNSGSTESDFDAPVWFEDVAFSNVAIVTVGLQW